MPKIVLFAFLTFLPIQNAFAQLDNHLFEDRKEIPAGRNNKVYLEFDVLGFVRNNEYFNKIADGYTLFGYQLNPHLSYYPAENVRIDAGIFLQKDFGREGYNTIAPTFSIKVKRGNWDIIFGNLDGDLNHRLIEPLFDFERALQDKLETGLQAVMQSEKLFFDAWVNWETMIYKGDPFQEEISGGLSADYALIKNNNFKLSLPIQTVLFHRGGQIDAADQPLVTLMNNALGLTAAFSINESGILKAIKVDNYYARYTDFSFEKEQPYEVGDGVYLNLTVDLKWLSLMTSYWYGREFISIKGAPLYQSVSHTFKNPGYVEPNRELLIFRFLHDLEIMKNLYLSTRFEPFFDLGNNKFEFSHGFYINYRPDFYLFKVKDEAFGIRNK